MSDEKVVLIIPTFNTLGELKELLKRLRYQTLIPDVLIIDNSSTDGTFDYVNNKFGLKLEKKTKRRSIYSARLEKKAVIRYIQENFNLGCGPGLKEGQIYAYKLGYKYQILSDSDAYPKSKNLIYELIKNTGKSACVPLNSKLSRYFKDKHMQKINSFQFHYLTITREMVKKVGYINNKYFIQFDDFDYSARLAKRFTITQLTNIEFEHAKGLSDILTAGSIRTYYYNRNVMIYYSGYHKKFERISKVLIYSVFGLFSCKLQKIPQFEYCMLSAILDGVLKKSGYKNLPDIKQEKLNRIRVKAPQQGLYISSPEPVDMPYLKKFIFSEPKNPSLFYLIYKSLKYKNIIVNNYPTRSEYLKLLFFVLFNALYIYDNGEFYKLVIK